MEHELAVSVNNKKQMSDALNTQGVSFAIRGTYSKAIDYYTKSLKMREELGDKRGIATSLFNIGAIYHEQGNLANAIEYYLSLIHI